MNDIPDTPRRLQLRVALKLMVAAGAAVAAAVASMYAGGGDTGARPADVERVDVADLAPGQARTLEWRGRPVVIIRRDVPTDATDAAGQLRVFFATDPVRGCPLRWSAGARALRSVCASAAYGPNGRPRKGTSGPALREPTHRVGGDAVVVLGRE